MKSSTAISTLAVFTGLICFFALITDAFSWNIIQGTSSPKLRSVLSLVPSQNYAKSFSKEAQELLRLGNEAHILSEKIGYYCRSLSKAGSAIIEEPYNTRYILNWANIRQLLGGTKCPELNTEGDVVKALDSALITTPKDPSVLYSAGLIYLWSNSKDKARTLFGDVLRYGQKLSQGQQAIVLNSIEKPEDIPVVIPGEFPHVINWQPLIMQSPILQKDVNTAIKTLNELGNLQLLALTDNRAELDRGIITTEIFEQRLYQLLRVTSSSHARRFIDGELSTSVYPNSETVEHRFFLLRSGLQEYPLVRTLLPLDTRPLKSSLTRWGRNDSVNFAGSYNTLGLFIEGAKPVSLISLQSRSVGDGPDSRDIHIYISSDNNEWSEITEKVQATPLRVLDYNWIALTLKEPVTSRYWKIHLSGTEKTRQFVNNLSDLVHVFGPPESDS